LLIAACVLSPGLYPGGAQQPSNPTTRHLYKVINRDGKTGFVDQTGQLVIGFDRFPADASIQDFHEGLALMCFPDPGQNYCRAIGYVDQNGNVAIAPRPYKYASDFREGLAHVENDEMHGFIDHEGKLVIRLAPDQHYRFGFYEGRCVIVTPQGQGLIDRTGKIVIEPRYSFTNSFSEGLAAVISGDPRQAKYGFINPKGETVIPPRFEARIDPGWPYAGGNVHLSRFSEGLAGVRDGGLYGYINKQGNLVIPPKFALAGDFSEGLASAVENDKVGFIDKQGRWVISPRFAEPQHSIYKPFGDGLAPVAVLTGQELRWGYIDKTGRMVIPSIFANAFPFKDGVAMVYVFNPFGRGLVIRYIDTTGRFLWEPK
jgi:hypothetical protein